MHSFMHSFMHSVYTCLHVYTPLQNRIDMGRQDQAWPKPSYEAKGPLAKCTGVPGTQPRYTIATFTGTGISPKFWFPRGLGTRISSKFVFRRSRPALAPQMHPRNVGLAPGRRLCSSRMPCRLRRARPRMRSNGNAVAPFRESGGGHKSAPGL